MEREQASGGLAGATHVGQLRLWARNLSAPGGRTVNLEFIKVWRAKNSRQMMRNDARGRGLVLPEQSGGEVTKRDGRETMLALRGMPVPLERRLTGERGRRVFTSRLSRRPEPRARAFWRRGRGTLSGSADSEPASRERHRGPSGTSGRSDWDKVAAPA